VKTITNENSEYVNENFKGLDCVGEMFYELHFEDCLFEDCDFSEASFNACKFTECQFIKCNLSLLKISECKFYEVLCRDSKVIGIDWTTASWSSILTCSPIQFFNCILNDSSFFGLNLNELVIEGCKAVDVDFREGDFNSSNFTYTDFNNALFRETNLSSVNFTEAENYNIDIYINEIKNAIFSRFEAVKLLESIDIKLVD